MTGAMLKLTNSETPLDAEAAKFQRAVRGGASRTLAFIRAGWIACVLLGLATVADGLTVAVASLLMLPFAVGSIWGH